MARSSASRPPSISRNRLLDEAERHLASAQRVAQEDPAGSYQLAYDAARKASAALLAVQGLRATSRGGHVAVQDIVRAQFGGPFDRFRTLRRRRHDSEYPGPATPTVTSEEAEEAAIRAQEMITAARELVASGALDVY